MKKISLDSDYSEMEDLFKEELKKISVESAHKHTIDQINNILNKKPKFPSVQAIVEDMQKRSGYLDYVKAKKESKDLETDGSIDGEPELFSVIPGLKQTINNIIIDTKGLLPVPAIFEKLQSIYSKDRKHKAWGDVKLAVYVSKLNKQEKTKTPQQTPQNLGKTDVSVDDSNEGMFSLFENRL